jgi:hypothetical protein
LFHLRVEALSLIALPTIAAQKNCFVICDTSRVIAYVLHVTESSLEKKCKTHFGHVMRMSREALTLKIDPFVENVVLTNYLPLAA